MTFRVVAITSAPIPDIELAKNAWILPGQSSAIFDVSPVNYFIEVQAMSADKFPFVLRDAFTIGPHLDDKESLLKFDKLISCHDKRLNHVHELVQGIIEGETRTLAASMTMEEVFRGTKEFKQEVFTKVQLELNQFGLWIYNANVKPLVDVPGHEYLSYLGQKTQMEAANHREAELAKKKAEWTKEAQVAEVEANKGVALREAELQREVESMNALTRAEKLKAEFLSIASVEYETKVREANLELYSKQKAAEALLYEKEKQAQSQKAIAEATHYSRKLDADGDLYAKQLEAEGLVALLDAFGGNYVAMRDYLMINHGMFQEIANAEAISVRTNGSGGCDAARDGGAMNEVAGVDNMLSPLSRIVQEQTGMLPLPWLGSLTLSRDTFKLLLQLLVWSCARWLQSPDVANWLMALLSSYAGA